VPSGVLIPYPLSQFRVLLLEFWGGSWIPFCPSVFLERRCRRAFRRPEQGALRRSRSAGDWRGQRAGSWRGRHAAGEAAAAGTRSRRLRRQCSVAQCSSLRQPSGSFGQRSPGPQARGASVPPVARQAVHLGAQICAACEGRQLKAQALVAAAVAQAVAGRRPGSKRVCSTRWCALCGAWTAGSAGEGAPGRRRFAAARFLCVCGAGGCPGA